MNEFKIQRAIQTLKSNSKVDWFVWESKIRTVIKESLEPVLNKHEDFNKNVSKKVFERIDDL